MNVQNIGTWIERNAIINPHKVALKQGDRALTYAQLAERVDRLSHALLARGFRKGDRIAILLRNNIAFLEMVFATARAGMIAVPLNWRLVADELAFILGDSGSSALLYETALGGPVADLVTRGKAPSVRVLLDGAPTDGVLDYETLLTSGARGDADNTVTFETAHVIMYTAGTTGRPKGVVLTHGNTHYQCVNALHLGILPDVRALAVLPFFHVGGLHGSALAVLCIGGTLVVVDRFDPGEILQIIETEKVHGLVGVPAMFLFMAQHPNFAKTDLSSVAVLTAGGAPLPVPLIETYEKRGVLFRQGYGLTECSAGVTGMDPADAYRKAGSAGKACFYTEVRVVDAHGETCPPNEAGEVVVRGPNVMREYWGLPKETAETVRKDWLHTGDIGKMDEEGYLYLVDRKKEMIISGGENIFPAEIENVLFGHPAVGECAVFGVTDPKFGERPVAVVVPRSGASVTSEEILAWLDGRLARYKMPREVHVRAAALPRNAAGKVLKPALRDEIVR